jgi:hypothetical protein
VHSRAARENWPGQTQGCALPPEKLKEPASEWKWRVLVEFYSCGIPNNADTSGKITHAKKNIADRIISNRQVNREVLCVMATVALWLVNFASRKGAASQCGFYS